MTDRARRSFLKTALLGGMVTGGAVLLPAGPAEAAGGPSRQDCGCEAPPPGAPNAPRFQLQVVNNSTRFQDLAVYQTPVDFGGRDGLSLAWLTAPAGPTTTVAFDWTETYNFVWGDTGFLTPGTVFRAGQVWPADPRNPAEQQVALDYDGNAFTFRQERPSAPQPGNLYIRELSTIPVTGGASVGIGMSGAGTFVVPAGPNFNLVFTPRPQYWVAAGTFQAGQALAFEEITNSAAIVFPPGVFSMIATLGPDNRWTVRPAAV